MLDYYISQSVILRSFVEVKGTSKMEPELVVLSSEGEEEAVPLRGSVGLGEVAHAQGPDSIGD